METGTLITIILVGVLGVVGIIVGVLGLRDWKRRIEGWKDAYQACDEYDECLLLGWVSGMCFVLSVILFLSDIYVLLVTLSVG